MKTKKYGVYVCLWPLSVLLIFMTTAPVSASDSTAISFTHALSLHGSPAHGPEMQHFRYVNPQAPKGGTLQLALLGSYDSFHLYGPKGKAPHGLFYLHDTLLTRNWDEPLSKYGVVAQTIERPADNSWVAFHINPRARFHDGQPITAKDIVFSFEAITTQGNLFWQQFYQDIASVEATSTQRVLFRFKHNRNRELPLLLGQLPVLASHWWQGRDFSESTLDIPVGSGPYQIHSFKPGRYIEYRRVPDYWARNHPVNIGRFNFDVIRYTIFRDDHVAVEALNSGQLDWRIEGDPRLWQSGYNPKALDSGRLIKTSWENHNSQTVSLVVNSRRPPLQDARVREAMAVLLNIDWILSHLLDNNSRRAMSLFANSEMAATGTPDTDELALLQPWRSQLQERMFQQAWPPAVGLSNRERLKYALTLFRSAGFTLQQGRLISPQGQPLKLELLLQDPQLERLLQGQTRRFAEAGISLSLRTVESARYLKHIRALEFDLIVHSFRHTPSPGQEQIMFWGSQGVDEPGTLNLAGVNLPVIDKLVQSIPAATSRAQLVTRLRALDRVLLWDFRVIPLYYQAHWQIVHSNRLNHPETMPRYLIDRTAWWHKPAQPGH